VSSTGTYIYRDGKIVKISDRPRDSIPVDVFFDRPYVDEHISSTGDPVLITSRRQKARLLKENHLLEMGGRMLEKKGRKYYYDKGR